MQNYVQIAGIIVGESITHNARPAMQMAKQTKAPDHNHEATQPMVDLPHTS